MVIEYMDRYYKCGMTVENPDYSAPTDKKGRPGELNHGILVYGKGMSLTIATNKVKNTRRALVYDTFSARAMREHHDKNNAKNERTCN